MSLATKAPATLKRRIIWYGALALSMLAGIGFMAAKQDDDPPNVAAQQTLRDLQIAAALARDVRDELKNPASFELVQAVVQPDGSVCMTYRATNSFNAVVTEQAVRPSRGETYWTSTSNKAEFRQRWGAACKPGGIDQGRMVKRML